MGFDNVVSWLPCGKAFQVFDPMAFEQVVLSHYFNQSQYKSFQRQLNIYGFYRITKGRNKGGYFHESCFVRGKPDLCQFMIRTKIKGINKRVPQKGKYRSREREQEGLHVVKVLTAKAVEKGQSLGGEGISHETPISLVNAALQFSTSDQGYFAGAEPHILDYTAGKEIQNAAAAHHYSRSSSNEPSQTNARTNMNSILSQSSHLRIECNQMNIGNFANPIEITDCRYQNGCKGYFPLSAPCEHDRLSTCIDSVTQLQADASEEIQHYGLTYKPPSPSSTSQSRDEVEDAIIALFCSR